VGVFNYYRGGVPLTEWIHNLIAIVIGVLVVNVTWKGKTYMGTLLDATKHDWSPPRYNLWSSM